MKRKLLSVFLVLCLVAALVPQTVLALTDTESNNKFAEAQKVTLGEEIAGGITEDDVDVYTFTLATSGKISLDVTAYMKWHCVRIFDANGTSLLTSDHNQWNATVGYLNKVYSLHLDVGTYYVQIDGEEDWDSSWDEQATGTYTIKTSFEDAKATEVEDNDTVAQANALTLGGSVNGQIAVNDATDFYKVELTESGRLTLEVTAYMKWHAVEVFNADGAQMKVSDHNEWNSTVGYLTTTHKLDLEKGIYYIKINGEEDYDHSWDEQSTGNYTLKATFTGAGATETEENDKLEEANALELGASVNGQIAINDSNDFFKVVLPKSGKLTIDMTAYMKWHAIELFDAEGTHMWVSDNNQWNSTVGSLNKIHNLDLEVGTYYLKINGEEDYDHSWDEQSTGNYTLKVAFADAGATETEENDKLEEANALTLGSAVNGQIAINDKEDFYKVELTECGRLTLDVTAYMKWHAVEVFNAEGTHLWVSDYNEWNSTVGYLNKVHGLDLEAGTYYIKINGEEDYNSGWDEQSTGNYTLKVSFKSGGVTEKEENDTAADANALALDGVVKGQISINDLYDYYKVVMPAADTLKINVTSYMKYYSIYLLSENGNQLWKDEYNTWKEETGMLSEEHNLDLEAGTYYIRVSGYQYGTSYHSTGTYMVLLNHTHSWDNGVVTKVPAGGIAGEKTYTCTVCGSSYTKEYWKADVSRIYGATRYQTSFAIADAMKAELGVDKFTSIVVACGTNFADALSGSYLAAVRNAPILITNGNNIKDIKEYIRSNLITGGTVYLLGGDKAVPKSMESGLDGFLVKRLGGATRYATNLLILKEAGVKGKDILICTGTGFADSLSASATGQPILLVAGKLTDEQVEFLKTVSGKKIILGGTSAVTTRVENQLKTLGEVERIGGATRYQTSVLVAERFFKNPEAAVLAYAQNFPDGLCGGPLADSMGAPLILTASGKDGAAAEYAKLQPINEAYVLGGPTLINDKAVKNIFELDAAAVIPVWAN